MSNFVEIPIENNPDTLRETMYERIQEAFPEWNPAKAVLDKWIVDACAIMGADLGDMNVNVQKEIFRKFGQTIIKIPPLEAIPARAIVTIRVTGEEGYTIYAGTVMTINASGNEKVAFRTKHDVVIPKGQTEIEEVEVESVEPGKEGNELTGPFALNDSIDYIVPEIEQTSVQTSGGVEAETPDEYLDRLGTELELLTQTPILPEDYAKAARQIAGVFRALAIDGYNPEDSSEENERMVAVSLIDELGEEVSAERQEAYKAAMEAVREVSFIVNILHPSYTELDVEVRCTMLAGFNPEIVKEQVNAAVDAYLDPSHFGNSQSQPREWRQIKIIRWTELIALVNNVSGVDYVTTLKLAKHGNELKEADVNLTGMAPLTRAKDVTTVVTSP